MALPNQTERSTQFPSLHPLNLAQLMSAVVHFVGKLDKYGVNIVGVWFHGDGNMYPSKKESDERKEYLNDHPVNEGAKYRKLFTRTDGIPQTLAEMEKVLVAAKIKEDQDNAAEQTKNVREDMSFPMIAAPAATAAQAPAPDGPQQAPPPPPLVDDTKKGKGVAKAAEPQ